MYRSICHVFGILGLLAGCGGTFGALDGLPPGPDTSGQPYPRLVDTPEPPEARLMAGAGSAALTRLTLTRESAAARKAKADAVPPVSDALAGRLPLAEQRRSQAAQVAPVSDDLLQRASVIEQRTTTPAVSFDEAALLARAERLRTSTAVAPAPIATAAPRRPVPLRPLNQSPVSSAFEERARLARERAAQAGS